MTILTAFEPIWILTTVGYLGRRQGLLGDTAASVLGRFVFYLAMPAAVFLALAATPLSHFALWPLLAFGASTAAVVGAGWLAAGRWFGRKPAEQPIWGMAAGYVNSANLGIPIAKEILGNLSFLAEAMLLQVMIVTPVILMALDRHGDAAGHAGFRRIATLPVRCPGILTSALGVMCSAIGYRPPPVLVQPLGLLASAAVPTALIALGASLYSGEQRLQAGRTELCAVTVLKLLAQPAIAFCVGVALHLTRPELLAVVVCAALPTAQNTFIFAQEYGVAEALASRAVMVTTTLSLLTLAAATALLGR